MINEVGPLSIKKSVITTKSRRTRNLSGGNLSSEEREDLSLEEQNAVNTLLQEGDQVDTMMIAEYNAKMQRQRLMTQQSWKRQYNNGASNSPFTKKATSRVANNTRNQPFQTGAGVPPWTMKNELLPTKIEVDQHLAMNPPPIMSINI